jgi:hypothetical protein
MTFPSPIGLDGWRARYTPATATDPRGAVDLGDGSADTPITFRSPPAGTWTIEIAVIFADGVGSASYFWRVAVSG